MTDPLKRELPKVDGAHLAFGLGVLYVFGFIVANLHFGKYELPRIELLRARYLAAALLFILCSAMPFAAGAFLSRAIRTRPADAGKMQMGLGLRETEVWAIGPGTAVLWMVFAAGSHAVLVSSLSLLPLVALGRGMLYFIMATSVSFALCMSLLGGEASSAAGMWPSLRTPGRVLLLAALVFALPAAFSSFVYGSLKPELGGGALWKARLTWRATADSLARANASGVVVIVDTDEQALKVIACAPKERPTLLTLPTADVSSVRLGELVSPSSFVDEYARHCSHFDAEQRVSTVRGASLLALTTGVGALSIYLVFTMVPGYWRSVRSNPRSPPADGPK